MLNPEVTLVEGFIVIQAMNRYATDSIVGWSQAL